MSIEPPGILVDTGTPELPVATILTSNAASSSAVGTTGGGGSNGTEPNGLRSSTTGSAPNSGGARWSIVGGILGMITGALVLVL